MNRQLFRYDPHIGYTFVPGLKTRVEHEAGGYLVRVNELGFRSEREFKPAKPSGVFRVLLFGDSFTAADGVSNRRRYSDLLEQLIPDLEVYNFGLSGTGTDQQYLIHQQFASRVDCDLVLIAVLVENIRRVAARYRTYQTAAGEKLVYAKPYFTLESDGRLTRQHLPVPKGPVHEHQLSDEQRQHVDRGGRFAWLRSTVNRFGGKVKDMAQRFSHYQPLPMYDSREHPDWQLMRAILLQWIAEIKVPVVLCPLPMYQHVEETADPRPYQQRFEELARESGATLHDPLDDYRKLPLAERQKFRFKQDVHPTPASHRVLADSLARCLRPLVEAQPRTRAA